MKKFYTFAIFLVLGIAANAQITDVITGLGNPSRIIINGTTMYIAENSTARISSTDYTASTPVLTPLFEGLSFPYGLHLNGTDIYVTTDTAISKFDYTEATPTLDVVVSGLNGPQASFLVGDQLYVAEYFANRIAIVDLSAATPTPQLLAPADAPDQVIVVGNFLYYSEFAANKISKIDITVPDATAVEVVAGLNGPSGLYNLGNDLYFTEYNSNTISKIDITDSNPTVLEVQTGFDGPTDISYAGGEFYVVQYRAGKISKFTDTTLAINQPNAAPTAIAIYPNPTTQGLKVSGLNQTQTYAMYNLTGAKIKAGSVSNNDTINVQDLSTGIYILKLENGSNLKFIKN